MTDLPESVGYLLVTGRVVSGIADSTDSGDQPDLLPNLGTVVFNAVDNSGTVLKTPIAVPSEKLLLTLRGITASLDATGNIVAPDDGESVGAQTAPGVRLVAPNQAVLGTVGWRWQATITPSAEQAQAWRGFSIIFSGVPGDVIDLSDAALIAATSALTTQPVVWSILSTDELPTGAKTGQFVFQKDTGDLFLIGA